MNPLIEIILSEDPAIRDQSLFAYCEQCSKEQLIEHCEALEGFWKSTDNLYHRGSGTLFPLCDPPLRPTFPYRRSNVQPHPPTTPISTC